MAEGDHDIYLAFLSSVDRTYVPHQVAFKNVTGALLDKHKAEDISDGDVVIDMHGHVVGMIFSPAHDFLYVNLRSWPPNATLGLDYESPPPIAREIEVKVVEMNGFTVLRHVFVGHHGLTPTERAFYLYLNATGK